MDTKDPPSRPRESSAAPPPPIWIRALVGAAASLIPSTIFAVIILAIALLMPLFFANKGGWSGALGPALLLIACVYVVGMVYSAWREARRQP